MMHDLHLVPNRNFEGVSAYMKVIVYHQPKDSLDNTLRHLIQLSTATDSAYLMQNKPFLMIAACLYIEAIGAQYQPKYAIDDDSTFQLLSINYYHLLDIIVAACKIPADKRSSAHGWYGVWPDLAFAQDAICSYHNWPAK